MLMSAEVSELMTDSSRDLMEKTLNGFAGFT